MIFSWILNGVIRPAPETYSLVAQMLQKNTILLSEIGDNLNIVMPTMGGEVFWDTLDCRNGYKLQRHKAYTFHARILDSDDFRIACGHIDAMKDKFERITRNHFLEEGDIIGVARKKAGRLYEHYAVYVGDNQVIHYAAQGGKGDFNGIIHLAPFDEFLKDDDEYFVLYFDDMNKMSLKNIFSQIFGGEVPRLFSPKETVQRAYSRLGEREYDLINNNCEHFAIWCKTGISESHQVKKILGGIMAVGAAVQYKKVYANNQET